LVESEVAHSANILNRRRIEARGGSVNSHKLIRGGDMHTKCPSRVQYSPNIRNVYNNTIEIWHTLSQDICFDGRRQNLNDILLVNWGDFGSLHNMSNSNLGVCGGLPVNGPNIFYHIHYVVNSFNGLIELSHIMSLLVLFTGVIKSCLVGAPVHFNFNKYGYNII